MYLSYYHLEVKPFQISTDPKFLWLGDKHKEAMAVLRYGVMDNKGFLLLTGEVGTGKTTLINALANTLGEDVLVATILDPGLEKADFYNYISSAFNLPEKFSTKGEFIRQFSEFLNAAHDQRKKVLLIIDEAQRLNQMLLEEIRLLSNIERQTAKLINIFFVGQKEFNGIILDPKNRALRQRITVNYDLKPLSQKETQTYIAHRLQVAGGNPSLFKSAAIREIYKFAKGYPRLINVICDRALLTGFTTDASRITPKIIKECASELTLSSKKAKTEKSPAPEKAKARVKKSAAAASSKGRILEKSLYILLACLIAAWMAAAIYFYFPKNIVNSFWQRSAHDRPVAEPPSGQQRSSETPAVQSALPEPPTKATGPEAARTVRAEPVSDATPLKAFFPKPQSTVRIDLTEQNELTLKAVDILSRLAAALGQETDTEILIKGYAGDGPGTFRYNKKMSEFTANIVKGFLVGKGVSPQRIETTGNWLTEPETEKAGPLQRQTTRWVQIQIKNG